MNAGGRGNGESKSGGIESERVEVLALRRASGDCAVHFRPEDAPPSDAGAFAKESEALAVGAEAHGIAALSGKEELACSAVPKSAGAVPRTGGDELVLAIEENIADEGGMTGKEIGAMIRAVPNQDFSIIAIGDQALAIGAPHEMSGGEGGGGGFDKLLGFPVPDLDRARGIGEGEEWSGGIQIETGDFGDNERREFSGGRHLEKADGIAGAVSDRGDLAVSSEADGEPAIIKTAMGGEDQLFSGAAPDLELGIVETGRQKSAIRAEERGTDPGERTFEARELAVIIHGMKVDHALEIAPGVALEIGIKRQRTFIDVGGVAPKDRLFFQVREGQQSNGFISELEIGADFGGRLDGSEALEAAADGAADTVGAGLGELRFPELDSGFLGSGEGAGGVLLGLDGGDNREQSQGDHGQEHGQSRGIRAAEIAENSASALLQVVEVVRLMNWIHWRRVGKK